MTETTKTPVRELAPRSAEELIGSAAGALRGQHRVSYAFSDAVAMARRNLLRLLRSPDQVVFSLLSPIMFTLLFRYVFGGAISGLQGVDYVTYLVPGIAVQTAIFSAGTTGFGLCDDLQKGFIDRLRSLPMARSAVLAGRAIADSLNNLVQVVILILVGVAVGFRPQSFGGLLLGVVLLLGFALSISFVFAIVGMSVSSVEAVNAATFPVVFPLTFASSAFVPTSTMPGWLKAFADHQPVSVVVNAVRSLVLGDITPQMRAGLLGGQGTVSLVLQSLAWTAGFTLVFGWLAVRKYRRLAA
ncbi:MAG TPA: ABC transporter permease [Mycobacteriales bacterium]|jgi:ABC-2 type transport system permease protein/oleandomycin transport system permease protein|nr:ABC transporter permease [Mycobacteriales bacterium]